MPLSSQNVSSLVLLKLASQGFGCVGWSVFLSRPISLPWDGHVRPARMLPGERSQLPQRSQPCCFVLFWGKRLRCVNTILYFIAISGLWAWSLRHGGVLITDSWCCQAVVMNNKLPPESGPSVLSFWHVAPMGGETRISFPGGYPVYDFTSGSETKGMWFTPCALRTKGGQAL